MSWQLRRATSADLDAIMLLESSIFGTDAWSRVTMQEELTSIHTYYLVAERLDDATVVGYAGLIAPLGAHEGDIQTIAVAEGARGAGLGRTLMQTLITEARKRGASKAFLEVRADNSTAHALYDSLGFVDIATRVGYYQPDNVDAVVMQYDIPDPVTSPAVGS